MAFDTADKVAVTDCGDELLPGTELFHGSYRITRFLNSGGFGITYLAKDSLDRDVVIKECFSSTFCRRTQSRVRARSQGTREQMQMIVRSFLNEARSLASLKHPHIVGVHQVFEDNDTAYMVMDHIRGRDLLDRIEARRTAPVPDQIVTMTTRLVSALVHVHANGLLHCDISPDNILVTDAGEPILIDFGAARRCAQGEAQRYSGLSVVKDGYSPHELYTSGGNSGPWSDIYALAASIYHAVAGVAPVNAQARLSARAMKQPDPCLQLAGTVTGYPEGFLESVDRAMSVVPASRFQTAAEWLKLLTPMSERRERKVVLLRRIVPAGPSVTPLPEPALVPAAAATATVTAIRPAAQVLPVRPRRPGSRTPNVDLSRLSLVSGFVGGWLIDGETGKVMAGEGRISGVEPPVGIARANFDAGCDSDEPVEDILIARGTHLHLIRRIESAPKVYLCVALDKDAANPLLARVQVKRIGQAVQL